MNAFDNDDGFSRACDEFVQVYRKLSDYCNEVAKAVENLSCEFDKLRLRSDLMTAFGSTKGDRKY